MVRIFRDVAYGIHACTLKNEIEDITFTPETNLSRDLTKSPSGIQESLNDLSRDLAGHFPRPLSLDFPPLPKDLPRELGVLSKRILSGIHALPKDLSRQTTSPGSVSCFFYLDLWSNKIVGLFKQQ